MRGPLQGRQLTIAFFPGAKEAESAYRTLRQQRNWHQRFFRKDGEPPSKWNPFSHLTLPDESLLVAWIDVSDLSSAIHTLQAAGARSIFLIAGGFPVPGEEAKCLRFTSSIVRASDVQRGVDELQRMVHRSRDYLVESVRLDHPASPAAQWVIDNAYLISLNLSDLRKELARSFKKAPVSRFNDLLDIAYRLVARTGARITQEGLREFLADAKPPVEWNSAQLWTFPLLVRLALVEELTKLACRCSRVQQLREAAFLWADRLALSSAYEDALLERMAARLRAEPFAKDRSFVVALSEQLQDQEPALDVVQRWMEQHPETALVDSIRSEHEREAADSLLASNAFSSLKILAQLDYKKVFEAVSPAERVLREDPADVYARSDFATRDHCRQVVARIARAAERTESDIAAEAMRMAKQAEAAPMNGVLYYLLAEGVEALEQAVGARVTARQKIQRALRRHATGVYVSSIIALTACFLVVVLSLASDSGARQPILLAVLGLLAILPLSELAIQVVHSLLINMFPPEALPKMDLRSGIPDDCRTLVVVPTMLSNVDAVRREVERLEIRYLANRRANLFFSLFSDFTDAPQRTTPSDNLLLEEARSGITALNRKYEGAPFLLFHRPRSWSATQQLWIGRERKRGKIEELNALLCGHGDRSILVEGTLPEGIRYVITLDSDTQLPAGAALRLVETIAHPLNRVHIDPDKGIRARGFTIIQPRVSIALPGATATRFTRIFSDAHGTDPYCTLVSDAQQDLCGEGIFHGKAIYDIQAFDKILSGRFPAETLLSHDLIEGAHVGTAFAPDIDLLEYLPLNYPSFAKRQHRWIRGDWQIAMWARGMVPRAGGQSGSNPLSLLNRWRLADNLRRSLVPVASLLLVAFAWFFSVTPGIWSIVLALTIGLPAVVPILDRWTRHIEGSVYGWQGASDDLKRAAVMIAFLPHQAWLSLDAIVRVLHRQLISKRLLLEWQTADAAESLETAHVESTMRQMATISIVSAAALLLVTVRGPLAPTVVYLASWIAAPWLMQWLGGTGPAPWNDPIGRAETAYLRSLARRTWRYFDDLVGPQSHWLPPDNSQLALRIEVAKRTSPTNIGLWLNSALAAHDFGYLTADDFVDRCSATLDTLGKLSRYEGHLLNWYDTETLQPLLPRYVSTVDSGNLIASLWVLAEGCTEIIQAPILPSSAFSGLTDTVDELRSSAGVVPSLAVPLRGLRETVAASTSGTDRISQLRLVSFHSAQLKAMKRWSQQPGDETTYWALKLASEIDSWTASLDRYLSWMELLSGPSDEMVRSLDETAVGLRRKALAAIPSLLEIADGPPEPVTELLRWRGADEIRPEVADWLGSVEREYSVAQDHARSLIDRLNTLSSLANSLVNGMNMVFLYDAGRRLFSIGHSVGNPLVFTSHYDLLASESRLASLVAIAKGDVPADHWFVLGRPRVSTPSQRVLLSWSGTMFEYLMPLIYTEPFANTLLATACEEAVEAQISYGDKNDIPWGISEAAYSALDNNQVYQYRAFGVPALALNPNADPGPVVSPYASVLALLVRPGRACANLRRLESAGLAGSMGFFESIDYTRLRRMRDEKPGVPIFAYMAHHQGMILLALSNVLCKNIVQRRFHADPRIRAIESLLFERVPITRVEASEVKRPRLAAETAAAHERRWTKATLQPRVHLNSNGRYSLMITNNGGGYSRWKTFDITRWRSDTALDCWGTFLWVKDLRTGTIWSPTRKPAGEVGDGVATFTSDRAEFSRRVQDLETKLEVAIATGDDAELRRLTISNRSLRSQAIELTFYAELALAPHTADTSHPVFTKMFIETECPEDGVLIAHRRLRSREEQPIWVAAVLVGFDGAVEFETDRRKFVGRCQTARRPDALNRRLSGTTGSVIDPIFGFRHRVNLEPSDHRKICFVVIAAHSREELMKTVRKYQRPVSVAHAFEMIWTRAQLEFRYLRIGAAAAHRYEDLAGPLLYPARRLRPRSTRLERNRLGQNSLWRYSISGDLPIVVVTVADDQGLGLVREVLLAHSYWRMLGLDADLVILNREPQSYDAPLHKSLEKLLHAHGGWRSEYQHGAAFLLDWQSLPPEDQTLLLSVARIVLGGHRGSLQQQLLAPAEIQDPPPVLNAAAASQAAPDPGLREATPELAAQAELGRFSADGREYVINIGEDSRTPAPWANVMANERAGAVVTESGLGFSWNGNSQMNRLTPWHNDPVSDPQSEVLYLRDDETGAVWSVTPLPARDRKPYRVRHGQGYTVYEHHSRGIRQELTVFIAQEQPVKICILRLENESGRARRMTATYFVEWVLGSVREQQQIHVTTSFNSGAGAILARQSWSPSFSTQVAFAASGPKPSSYCGDRVAFFEGGSHEKPGGLRRQGLDNRCGAGLDPCAALQVALDLQPGAQRDLVFLLGQAETEEATVAMARRFTDSQTALQELTDVRNWWDRQLEVIQVQTPCPTADVLINRWLLYQTLSCRIWGRSATYQSGGAIGFRDQLQDCLAVIYTKPDLSRAHILRAAARQFLEGDVQHWWHAESGLGVRTRCSDDLLWLPWVTARYLQITQDTGILDEPLAFLEGPELDSHEQDKMFIPAQSAVKAPLRQHCIRAIERASRFGAHGLPLIGNGDWNDGLNRVGSEGRGESVWVGWFLLSVLDQWIPLVDAGIANRWRQRAGDLTGAMEQHAWDGEWYLRGYFDDGSPLGSSRNSEAQIDSLPQSWSALSNRGRIDRVDRSLASAKSRLVRPQEGLVLLFTPPFNMHDPHPGYIMGYPPGTRENGGQYTHGSLWLAQAMARRGDGAGAVEILQTINPAERTATPQLLARYRGEPYAVAADVSSSSNRSGEAGWTWYTGSAGWMYRIWVEDILGFRLSGSHLSIEPSIPDSWPGYTLRYRFGSSLWRIEVTRAAKGRGVWAECDGEKLEGGSVTLTDDGAEHVVRVSLGSGNRDGHAGEAAERDPEEVNQT